MIDTKSQNHFHTLVLRTPYSDLTNHDYVQLISLNPMFTIATLVAIATIGQVANRYSELHHPLFDANRRSHVSSSQRMTSTCFEARKQTI